MKKQIISTRSTLAKRYGVSLQTFLKWLAEIPQLKLKPNHRILTPKQLQILNEELGEPPEINSKKQ